MQKHTDFLRKKLQARQQKGSLRSLQSHPDKIDFWSNDYLGFARSPELRAYIATLAADSTHGATGSRLISGNDALHETTEKEIADFHQAESALLFNSGYDAGLGLFSCIAAVGDTIFYDETVHACIHDGLRLSRAQTLPFRHNDLRDLENKMQAVTSGNIFVAVESVYSMDGDVVPLPALTELAEKYGAAILIDEAHATGWLGATGGGLVDALGLQGRIFARIHTYGKAMGAHGAAVLGSTVLRDYLMNYARSFIFTTALPPQNLHAIRAAYHWLKKHPELRKQARKHIEFFRKTATPTIQKNLLPSETVIQGVVIPGNERAKAAAAVLQTAGFAVKAILYPTVPRGQERIRVCLHAHNTEKEIRDLLATLDKLLR